LLTFIIPGKNSLHFTIITVGVEVPIDNQIKTWDEATVPANWQSLRLTWNKFHALRTCTSVLSVLFFAWGLMKRIGTRRR
jgi:hypothetical protein